jgi:hypothetical protein
MSDHITRHRAQLEKEAYPIVEQFIQHRPHYRIDPDQSGSQSVTNYVIFGHRDQQPVVFKYFCRDERRIREVFALQHFAETKLVPNLLDDDGQRLIVQSRIPGRFLHLPEDGPPEPGLDPDRIGFSLGQAAAQLTAVPLSPQTATDFESRFYDGEKLPEYFDYILQASHRIQRQIRCYQPAVFAQSLAKIDAHLDFILNQPRLIYHQDAMNLHFADSQFVGFFDLEMCRVGTEAMQIGALWYIMATLDNWPAFVDGYATPAGRRLTEQDFVAAQAFAHFLVWRYISHYGDWPGDPLDADALNREMAQADRYRQSLERIESIQPPRR